MSAEHNHAAPEPPAPRRENIEHAAPSATSPANPPTPDPVLAPAPGVTETLEALSKRLSDAHAAIDRIERRRAVEQAALAAGASDPAAGAAVIERELSRAAATPGIAPPAQPGTGAPDPAALERAARQARAARPDLFRGPARAGAGGGGGTGWGASSMSPALPTPAAGSRLDPGARERAREAAQDPGGRKALLDYMRARRGV